MGDGKMAQQLRTFSVFAEDLGFPALIRQLTSVCLWFQFQGIQCPLLTSRAPGLHMVHVYTHAGKTLKRIKQEYTHPFKRPHSLSFFALYSKVG